MNYMDRRADVIGGACDDCGRKVNRSLLQEDGHIRCPTCAFLSDYPTRVSKLSAYLVWMQSELQEALGNAHEFGPDEDETAGEVCDIAGLALLYLSTLSDTQRARVVRTWQEKNARRGRAVMDLPVVVVPTKQPHLNDVAAFDAMTNEQPPKQVTWHCFSCHSFTKPAELIGEPRTKGGLGKQCPKCGSTDGQLGHWPSSTGVSQ